MAYMCFLEFQVFVVQIALKRFSTHAMFNSSAGTACRALAQGTSVTHSAQVRLCCGRLRAYMTGGACRGERALGSCAAVSASLLLPAATAPSSPLHLASGRTAAGTPVLITHGASDDVVPRADVDATAALLNKRCPGGPSLYSQPWV